MLLVAPLIIGALVALLATTLGVEWAGLYAMKLGMVLVLAGGTAILLRSALQRWAANDRLDAFCVVAAVFLWTTFVAGRMYLGDHSVADNNGGFRPISIGEAISQTLIAGTFAATTTAVVVFVSLVLLSRFFRT